MENMSIKRDFQAVRIGGYAPSNESLIGTVVKAIFGIVFTMLLIVASVLCTLMAGVGLTYVVTESCMINPVACWIAFGVGMATLLLIAGLEKLLFGGASEILHLQFKVASTIGCLMAIILVVICFMASIEHYWIANVLGWSIFVSIWYAGITYHK